MASPEAWVSDMSEFRARSKVTAASEVTAATRVEGEPGRSLPVGTVTFLLTDIEDSTPAWEAHGELMAVAVARHYEILDAVMSANGGIRPLEQGEGDSLVAVFSGAADAVAAALAAQQALAREAWPDGVEVAVRMAVHTGEAHTRDGRYYDGPTIIRCARLRALAYGGQVLISGTTADLLGDRLPAEASLRPVGVHRLKGLRQAERVFQLAHPGLVYQFPPLRSLDALPNNLPTQLTSFVGREAELAEIGDLLDGHRLVTLIGAGGAGKTRLAAEVCGELVDRYADGVWWVDLGSLAEGADLARAVMTGLGLLDSRGLEPVQRITRYLVERQVLLVLDNCEHVLTPVAWLVDAVLRACPRASVLATSREPIGVAGEIAWKVPPLTLPPSPSCEAMRLFVERGGEVRPGFRLDEDTAAAVEAICVRLDGIPLAIELAAARLRSLSPERILEALSDRFRLLTGGARTALPRHQTLQASMAWSHDLLTEAERALFRRLSVFNGGFTLDAAAAVGAGDPLADREVLTLLSNLVDKSLVVFEGERYRLLQTMADFAGTKLVESGEAGTVRDRHAAWMVAWAENISPELERGPRPEVLDRVEADHDNVRAALGWLLERQAHDAGMRLVAALAVFWTARGHYTEGRRWCRRVLEAAPQESSALRGRALWALSHLREWGMALEEGYGIPENQVVLALGEQLADPSLVARALVDQILLAAYATPDVGPALCERALEAARRAGDEHALGMAHWGTAFYWNMARARCDEAAPHLEAVAEHARRTASPYWRGWGQLAAGIGHWYQGRLAEARQALGDAVRCGEELDEPKLELYASVFLSNVMLSQGDYENATRIVEYFGARQLRSLDCAENWPQGRLALIALAHGDHAEAARVFANFGPIYLGYGIPYLSAEHALIRVRIAQADEDLAGARAALREAMAFSDQLANPWLQAEAHHLDGLLHRAEGDPGAAEHAHHQALALCAEYGFRGRAAEVLEELASLAAAGESHAEAVRLLGVAWALREATGEQRSPTAQADFEAESTVLTGALGEATYDALFKEGTALSFDAAMTYASRARGERKRPSSGWAALTPAELAVVALAAAGLSNAEIGHRLFISPATAKTHLAHIYAKLGVANRAALAAQATARSTVK